MRGYTTRDTQIRLAGLGFDPGPIDGMRGPKTRSAMKKALAALHLDDPSELFHPSGLLRIHWHWTAGAVGLIPLELRHYNILIDHDGNVHDGDFRPEAQANYRIGAAASHTLNANSHAIGMGLDGMAGAVERPFDQGHAPLKEVQVDALVEETADLCVRYDIPVSKWTTLSHAEVQPTLGIRQRNKWDIIWLPHMDQPTDPITAGNILRDRVRARLGTNGGTSNGEIRTPIQDNSGGSAGDDRQPCAVCGAVV